MFIENGLHFSMDSTSKSQPKVNEKLRLNLFEMQNAFLHSQGDMSQPWGFALQLFMSQRGGKWNQHENTLILSLTHSQWSLLWIEPSLPDPLRDEKLAGSGLRRHPSEGSFHLNWQAWERGKTVCALKPRRGKSFGFFSAVELNKETSKFSTIFDDKILSRFLT